jgi:hypothetical protein
VADHREDLVLVHQLLRGQYGLLRVIGGILDLEHDLAAMDAALLVDLVHAQHHAQSHLLAEAGNRTRKILNGAQRDLRLGHALVRVLGQRAGAGQRQRRSRRKDSEFHGALSPVVGSLWL